MNLPNIKPIAREMVLPSTGNTITYYPMTSKIEREMGGLKNLYTRLITEVSETITDNSTKEEKELATKEFFKHTLDMKRNIINTLAPCFPGVDFEKLTDGDIDYMQINLRRKSVNDIWTLNASCPNCEGQNTIIVNLNEIEPKKIKYEEEILLEDGSILVVGHIPYLLSIESISNIQDELDMEYELIINSFKELRYKIDDNFQIYSFENMPVEDKIEWAFTNGNLTSEQRDQIIVFLDENKPNIEPIKIEVTNCKHKIYEGKFLSTEKFTSYLNEDIRLRQKHMTDNQDKENPEPYISKLDHITTCGHSYNVTIESMAEYINFF